MIKKRLEIQHLQILVSHKCCKKSEIKFNSKNANNSMNKYQLITRNIKTLEEKQIFVFKPRWLCGLTTFILLLIIGLSFWMFNTIFSKWVNPLDYYNISSEKFTQIVHSLSELELTAKQNEQFVNLLQNIIAGKEVDIQDAVYSKKDQSETTNTNNLEQNKTINLPEIEKNAEARTISPNREQNASSNFKYKAKSSLQEINNSLNKERTLVPVGLIFFSPTNGNIVSHYMSKGKLYKNGISIISPPNTPICCVADGVIIFSEYLVDHNLYTTIIQHNHSIISVYRHFGKCLFASGAIVHTGDVISIVDNSNQNGDYNFVFELWIDFHHVNPEDYILF